MLETNLNQLIRNSVSISTLTAGTTPGSGTWLPAWWQHGRTSHLFSKPSQGTAQQPAHVRSHCQHTTWIHLPKVLGHDMIWPLRQRTSLDTFRLLEQRWPVCGKGKAATRSRAWGPIFSILRRSHKAVLASFGGSNITRKSGRNRW